jgi:hypothetical protein
MTRALFFSLFAVSAAWALVLKSRNAPYRKVAAADAAALLRQAWAKNHTIA